MNLLDDDLLVFAIGLMVGMYGPALMAWVFTMGEVPRTRTARLRDLLDEEPRTRLGRVPRQRGRHGHRVR